MRAPCWRRPINTARDHFKHRAKPSYGDNRRLTEACCQAGYAEVRGDPEGHVEHRTGQAFPYIVDASMPSSQKKNSAQLGNFADAIAVLVVRAES
jgi:hypothetical protein